MTDIEVLEREKQCVQRKTAINCSDCAHCDLLMDDAVILAAYDWAISALRAQQQPNAPLTLDELREMDGEPVWAIGGDGTNEYVLIDKGGNGIDADTGFWDSDFYGLPGDGAHGLNVLGWLAYRQKPEEGTI